METTLEALKFLSTPFENIISNDEKTDCGDILLTRVIEKCRGKIELGQASKRMSDNCGQLTCSWNLTITLMDILLKLKGEIEEAEFNQTEEERCIEVLSIQAQINVQKCVELVIGFGILPYLLRDVGVPSKVRKTNAMASKLFLAEDLRQNPLIKLHRLAQVLEILLVVSSSSSLSQLIIPKHSGDMLSALFQLCKSPVAKPSLKPGALSQSEYDYVMKLREQFKSHLNNFLTSVPKGLLINSLFLIGEKPKFMRESCTLTIQDILLSPEGLILITTTLINETASSNVWNLARVISNLMRNSLIRISSQDNYLETLSGVCAQCLKMINQDSNIDSLSATSVQTKKEVNRIGLFCSIVLMDINCRLSKTLVWDHLFKPVVDLGSSQSQDQCEMKSINRNASSHVQQLTRVNEDIITSVDIERVIGVSEVAEGLLSLVIPTGLSIPIHYFQPLWSLLFQVLVTCWKYLARKVQEPKLSQLAQVLNNKLENVFLLMLEVVSAGAGNKLELNSSGAVSNNSMSQERAKSVCKFCIELLINENNENGKTNINSFELVSSSQDESVKIVRVAPNIDKHSRDEPTYPSGCQSSTSPLQIEYNNENEECNTTFEVLADECVILCSILKQERVAHITSELFRQLLNYENNDIEKENCPRKKQQDREPSSDFNIDSSERTSSNALTQLELKLQGNVTNNSSLRKFVALKLLEELGGDEKTMENCVKTDNYKDTLLIVELVMRKLATELKECVFSGENYEFSQTIVFALGFLGTIVETACSNSSSSPGLCSVSSSKAQSPKQKQDEEFWDELQRFLPHLKMVAESNDLGLANSGIPSMAENILMSIESRGKAGIIGKEKVKETEFKKALKDASNPMLPIKGHGLLQLRRLIEARDAETLKNDTLLLQIFQTELTNEDSYVYLMAIQGLATLGLKFHKIIIPLLIQEYHFINLKKEDCTRSKLYSGMMDNERIECGLKIGEVLVKVIQQLGEIAPMYRVQLTNLFFLIVRHDEPMIRASALSNLGELCHLLKFSLGVVLTEVWFNVDAVLSCEKDIHVRRAALHLLVLLLKGVEKDISVDFLLTNVQLGSYLRDARRLLTKIEQREVDSVARTHAQLALQELELIVKKLLVPNTQLSYKIRVLD